MRLFQCVSVPDRLRVSGMFTAILFGTLAMNGCKTAPKETVAAPASEETVRLVRQSLTAADPKAVVGLVIAVLPSEMYAAVGDVPVADFHEGEPISFIDTNKKFLVNGTVKKVTADALHVQYELPGPDSRAPQVGDLAVRFKP